MGRILDGKAIAKEIRSDLERQLSTLKARGIVPRLVVVLVGDNPASASYVRSKERMAGELGFAAEIRRLPEATSQSDLIAQVAELNEDDTVDAILVQLPLPAHIDEKAVLVAIHPDKDVDGFHPYNIGRYAVGQPLIWPCTTSGIFEILKRSDVDIAGKTAVIVGRSSIVGWPTSQLLLANDATVIQCHSKTQDITHFTRQADILVVAVGKPGLIGVDDIKEGAIVIDVGMNRVDGKLTGDVNFEEVVQKAGAITPVPGGVGPLTVTMLMQNTIHLAVNRRLRGHSI